MSKIFHADTDCIGMRRHHRYRFHYLTRSELLEYKKKHKNATVVGFTGLRPVPKNKLNDRCDYLQVRNHDDDNSVYFRVKKPRHIFRNRYVAVGDDKFVASFAPGMPMAVMLLLILAAICCYSIKWRDKNADTIVADVPVVQEDEVPLGEPGYRHVNDGEPIEFNNDASNTSKLQYHVLDADTGETIYETGHIKSGESEKWVASNDLSDGEHETIFTVEIYSDDGISYVGSRTPMTIRVGEVSEDDSSAEIMLSPESGSE